MQHTHLNERQVLVGEEDVDAALGDEGHVVGVVPPWLTCWAIRLSLEGYVDRDGTGHHDRALHVSIIWKRNCNLVQVRVFDDCRRLATASTPRWS